MTAVRWRSQGSPIFWKLVDAYFFEQLSKSMSKWQYDKAGDFTPRKNRERILDALKTPEALRPVADAFVANVYRIYAFWWLKPEVMERACVITGNLYSALFAITGHVDFDKAEKDDPDILKKMDEKFREYALTESFDSRRAVLRWESFLEHSPEHWDEGIEATLVSMVTGAWTTFEVLASDLWEAAVNAHPRTLTDLSGKRNRIAASAGTIGREKEEEKHESSGGGPPPNVLELIKRVTRGTFNAGELMGTVLKPHFAFHKLSGIRRGYSTAFSKRSEKIDRCLSDKALDKLNLVRNLFLHDAGTVKEDKFARGAKEIGWTISVKAGRSLPLNGETVRDLIAPVFQLCVDLILAVDEWISPNDADDDS